jgi:hypothetical protein
MSEQHMDKQQGGSHPTPADRHKESIPPPKENEPTGSQEHSVDHPTGKRQAAENLDEELPA